MTTLYYSPGACSIGIHVLLEEVGAPYDLKKVNLQAGEQYQPTFVQINPKSKVPTLMRDDGSVLTEFPAIALWLALTHPERKLLPADPEAKARVFEAMDYVVATIHGQAFARLFRPANFSPNEADHEAVKARGVDLAKKGFANIDAKLTGRNYLIGEFSIADAALFYVELWARRTKVDLPSSCQKHFESMMARPSVQRVLKAEGVEV